MNSDQLDFPERFLTDYAEGGNLSTLSPVGPTELEAIVSQYKGISLKYISFIARIGVGETRNGLFICEPYSVEELVNHPSFQVYNSPASRRLFGLLPPKPTMPKNLVCVADPAASWRYCLDLGKGDGVYCFDMCGPHVTKDSDDFFAFIKRQIDDKH